MIGLATAIRNNSIQGIFDAIDAGAGAGKLKLYTGARPATGAAITNQILLGTVPCSDPCGTVAAGVGTFAAFTDDENSAADGRAAWARAEDSADSFCCDLTVGFKVASTTSLAIGLGSKTFTVATGKLIDAGETVKAVSTATGKWMSGTVTSYNSGTGELVIDVTATSGTGTLADWGTIVIPATADIVLVSREITAGNILRITSGTITDGNG